MKQATRRNALKFIIILGVIGLLASFYLIENHYASPTEGSLCDFGETVSCSLVNTSVFSELFNVPVALFGALWFIVIMLMAWNALKKERELIAGMLLWSAAGILFVAYMIISEFILQAICPVCTLVHIIVLVMLIISIILYKTQEPRPKRDAIIKAAKPWLIGIIIINIIPIVYFNLPSGEERNLDALAKCMTENGVNMYSSFRCGVCAKVKAFFGDSFQYVNEIECHPQGKNAQTERCLKMDIKKTPTWILEKDGVEIKRLVGFQSPETLAEFAGCPQEVLQNG